jgi:mono/diheme cytochrome c family protein
MSRLFATLVATTAVLLSPVARSDDPYARAQFDYQMHCQGCHTPDGRGADSVPRMKDHVGVFLQSPEGRDYLVRVPGSATSALPDERLAAVLNWILVEFAGDSLAAGYRPYTAAEVGRLRQQPLNEVDQYRAALLGTLAAKTGRDQ